MSTTTVALTFTAQANGLIAHLNQKYVDTSLTLIKTVADAIQFVKQLERFNSRSFFVLQHEIKQQFPLLAKWYF